MKLDFRQRLLATTLMVGAGMLATPAFAQDTAAPDTQPSGPVEAQPPAQMDAQPTEAAAPADEALATSSLPAPEFRRRTSNRLPRLRSFLARISN